MPRMSGVWLPACRQAGWGREFGLDNLTFG